MSTTICRLQTTPPLSGIETIIMGSFPTAQHRLQTTPPLSGIETARKVAEELPDAALSADHTTAERD